MGSPLTAASLCGTADLLRPTRSTGDYLGDEGPALVEVEVVGRGGASDAVIHEQPDLNGVAALAIRP